MEQIIKTNQNRVSGHKVISIGIEVVKVAAILYVLISTYSVLST